MTNTKERSRRKSRATVTSTHSARACSELLLVTIHRLATSLSDLELEDATLALLARVTGQLTRALRDLHQIPDPKPTPEPTPSPSQGTVLQLVTEDEWNRIHGRQPGH